MIGSQKDYADHIGKTKQYVNKLVKNGKIPLRPDRKIDFAEADFALNRLADPARQQTPVTPPVSPSVPASDLFEAAPTMQQTAAPTFADVKTAREGYQAKLSKLQYEREIGKLVNKAELEKALVSAGRSIRQKLDALPAWAGELFALVQDGGSEIEVRKFLKSRVHELEETISENLAEAANGASKQ